MDRKTHEEVATNVSTFIDSRVEDKLAHPDQVPASVLEAMKMAYAVRQKVLSGYETALDELLRMQEQAARHYIAIEDLQRRFDAAPEQEHWELLQRIDSQRALATEIESYIGKARDQLIATRAVEYQLTIKI